MVDCAKPQPIVFLLADLGRMATYVKTDETVRSDKNLYALCRSEIYVIFSEVKTILCSVRTEENFNQHSSKTDHGLT